MVGVRVHPCDGRDVESERHADAAHLGEGGGDEHHPLEHHEDAEVREQRRREHSRKERFLP